MGISHLLLDPAYMAYETQLEKEIMAGEIPKHLAIIMDGNRRYAKEYLNSQVSEGHNMGKRILENVLRWCLRLGIRNLTVYAFSVENFSRNKDEVEFIMDLLAHSLRELADTQDIHDNRVRVRIIGDRSLMPPEVIESVEYVEGKTASYSDYNVNLAVAYGGRQDITTAVRTIAERVKNGEMEIEDINEEAIASCISTSGLPDPDLILRTSGEVRVSNFLLWQMAYSELYFTDVYWPGFRYIDLLRAIRSYQQRKRRYGV
jgi:tritrans,polycis-undecaprenyl-diphosphate synthase [geranylgeranyl-diphosphate specific]